MQLGGVGCATVHGLLYAISQQVYYAHYAKNVTSGIRRQKYRRLWKHAAVRGPMNLHVPSWKNDCRGRHATPLCCFFLPVIPHEVFLLLFFNSICTLSVHTSGGTHSRHCRQGSTAHICYSRSVLNLPLASQPPARFSTSETQTDSRRFLL